ncbi:MAG TPA: NAD(P)-dependent alcohol dehydrogenase [Puia sp.]|nr:NAD(P)-dependent alcohol dehydrogenase [Puia sp.]
MKTIQYGKFGDVHVLQMVDIPQPTIASKQVLIKIKAVSINPMDWKIRKGEMKLMSGSHFPKGTGVDFSGIIEEAGKDITHFKKGDEVFGIVNNLMKEGALAEYVAVNEDKVWVKPASLSFSQASTIPIVGAAAALAVEKIGDITNHTEILINGATGGFGMYLLQLLKQKGGLVTAVSNTAGVAFAKKWGANFTIDYTKQNVLDADKPYDVVVDLSGKMGYDNAKHIMKEHSAFINPTPKPIEIISTPVIDLFVGKKHIVLLSSPSSKNIPMLVKAVDNGLQIEVSKTFGFDHVTEAYTYAEKGGYIGKVTIELN